MEKEFKALFCHQATHAHPKKNKKTKQKPMVMKGYSKQMGLCS